MMFQSTLVSHLFIVHLWFLFVKLVLGSLASTHLLVTHVGPCDGSAGLPMTFNELVITTQTVDCSLTGVFNLSQDVANGWIVKVDHNFCEGMNVTTVIPNHGSPSSPRISW